MRERKCAPTLFFAQNVSGVRTQSVQAEQPGRNANGHECQEIDPQSERLRYSVARAPGIRTQASEGSRGTGGQQTSTKHWMKGRIGHSAPIVSWQEPHCFRQMWRKVVDNYDFIALFWSACRHFAPWHVRVFEVKQYERLHCGLSRCHCHRRGDLYGREWRRRHEERWLSRSDPVQDLRVIGV